MGEKENRVEKSGGTHGNFFLLSPGEKTGRIWCLISISILCPCLLPSVFVFLRPILPSKISPCCHFLLLHSPFALQSVHQLLLLFSGLIQGVHSSTLYFFCLFGIFLADPCLLLIEEGTETTNNWRAGDRIPLNTQWDSKPRNNLLLVYFSISWFNLPWNLSSSPSIFPVFMLQFLHVSMLQFILQ